MAIGSFFELAHSSGSYASFVQSAMQQISGQGSAPPGREHKRQQVFRHHDRHTLHRTREEDQGDHIRL